MGTPTCHRILWVLFARLCTLIFPDFILKYIVGLRTAGNVFTSLSLSLIVVVGLLNAMCI